MVTADPIVTVFGQAFLERPLCAFLARGYIAETTLVQTTRHVEMTVATITALIIKVPINERIIIFFVVGVYAAFLVRIPWVSIVEIVLFGPVTGVRIIIFFVVGVYAAFIENAQLLDFFIIHIAH
jgi:hypothetical protein